MKRTTKIWSLHRITEYPLNFNESVYREYPLLKHGLTSSVKYFAQKLTPLAEKIIRENENYSRWLLTSPAFDKIPAAANLLCNEIFKNLQWLQADKNNISILDLAKDPEDTLLENEEDFSNYNDYSKFSWSRRLAMKDKHRFLNSEKDLDGCGIIFINDINVTGASREYISSLFASFYSGIINWLYIIDCNEKVGRSAPQLENEINNFTINTAKGFGTLLTNEQITLTAKCISKLFTYDGKELEDILSMLHAKQLEKIWETVQFARIYQGDFFKEQMTVLRTCCKK